MKTVHFKVLLLAALLTLPLFSMFGCAEEQERADSHAGIAFDTVYDFCFYGDVTLTHADLSEKLSELTELFSVANEGATLETFNRSDSLSMTIESDDLCACLSDAFRYAALTNGAFDITLGALRELWDIKGASTPIPSADQIEEARKNSGFALASFDAQSRLLTRANTSLGFDLGAIAKGYTVQLLAELYASSGAVGGVLDFGGTVTVFGEKPSREPYTVGIRSPYGNADTYAGYLTLLPAENSSLTVSVSGLYERYRESDGAIYTHIFDGASGYPLRADTQEPDRLLSAAVISENGAQADALSTALLVMGQEKAEAFCTLYAEELNFSALLFAADGQVTECGTLDYTPLS